MIKRLNVLLLLFLCASFLQAEDFSDEVPDVAAELDSIQNSLKEIDSACAANNRKYLSSDALNINYKETVEEKIEKGNYYFEKGDFATSGSIFYSVIVSYDKKDAVWFDSLYKLAESLFRNKNYISAARYYEMLITSSENADYKTVSLKRLVAASYALGNYSEAKGYYNKFLEIGYDVSKDQDLLYFLGKSLFYDNQNADAVKVFSSIEKEALYYPQARYFLGVIAIREHKLDEALAYYEDIAKLQDNGKYYSFQRVYDLSVLGAARVAFELNNLEKASHYYISLDKRSDLFAEAYYELCWTYIKKDDYERAVEALRLIKYIAPDSVVTPKAETLEGTLLVKMRKYGEAMLLFDSIVKKYGKVQDELFSIDGKVFMMNGKAGRVSDLLLPYSPIVQSLLKDNKKFSGTIKLNESIVDLEEEIQRVNTLENKIGSIVDNGNVASLFPPLKAGLESALYLRNRLASIRNNLMMIRKAAVWKTLSEEQREEFDRFDAKKAELLGVLETSMIAPNRIEQRAVEYAGKVIAIDEEIHRVSMELNAVSKELESVIVLYAKEKKVAPKYEKEFLDRVGREREALKQLFADMESYKAEIEAEKNRLVLGGDIIGKEIAIRDALNEIVRKQNEILESSPAKADFARIAQLLDEADRIDRNLADFYLRLNDATKELIATVRVSYEKEKTSIAEYKSELLSVKREVEEMAILAMYSNINFVKNTFADIILQADLGIIDVAWEKKDESSSEIMRLRTQRAQEVQQLYLDLDGEQ